jgi:hypothetical protein
MGDPCAKYPCGRAHHGRGRRRLSPTSRPLTVGAEEASFGRHPRRRHRPCHHLGRSRRRCRALRRVGRPFRPSAPSVKKHERVTAVSGPTVDLEGHFWCYGPYITMKKITCGRLKLVLTFPSLSRVTSQRARPAAPGSGGSPPSPDFEDLYVMPLAVGYAPRKSQLISQRASRNGPLFVLLLIERLHHDPEKLRALPYPTRHGSKAIGRNKLPTGDRTDFIR